MFLNTAEKQSDRSGVRINLSRNATNNTNGRFTENRLSAMLQASDYDSLDNVSSFLRAAMNWR